MENDAEVGPDRVAAPTPNSTSSPTQIVATSLRRLKDNRPSR
jgi:hypothetical protein